MTHTYISGMTGHNCVSKLESLLNNIAIVLYANVTLHSLLAKIAFCGNIFIPQFNILLVLAGEYRWVEIQCNKRHRSFIIINNQTKNVLNKIKNIL